MISIPHKLSDFINEIFDEVETSFIITDPNQEDNPIVYANKVFFETFEYSPNDILGKNCRLLQGTDHLQDGVAELREGIANLKHVTATLRNYTKNGDLIYNQVTVKPLFDKQTGKLQYFMGIQKNVTQQVIELQSSKNSIKDKAISSTLSTIAHHWRQPLQIITLKLMETEFDFTDHGTISPDKLKLLFQDLNKNISQLSLIIDRFASTFSPQEQLTSFNLNELIKDVMLLEKVINNQAGITFMFSENISKDTNIVGYRNDLLHVFHELISNSVEALLKSNTKEKMILVDILSDEQEEMFYIDIIDNSHMLDDTILDNLFDPYFSTKNDFNGTGLGLYKSKIIIESYHNGKLTVTLDESNNTVFRIALPFLHK